uniref:DUF5899 domain-containing protein n=1 Tax=viral metagenome TaxID=1070528 RepID=A0A6C0D4M2_9ZZZZ
MEVAIPLFALASLYFVNNQTRRSENFTNQSQLPNIDIPNRNYPSEYPVVSSETDQTSELSTQNRYDNGGGVYTDKYFNPEGQGANSNNSSGTYYSLTGNKVDGSYFQHNNMVPFFGSNLRNQHIDSNATEGLLDSYSGAGSQTIIKKEQSPLFAPHTNLQWANGVPNQSDFIQSRINPSSRMANVKPFAEEKVGPGLGLGYTTEGSGGYNSGMMARDQWREKTVDELRVGTNPKASGYSLLGHEGPADSFIKTMATQDQMGVYEKNRPEQSFALDQRSGPDDIGRLFVTGGAQTAPTMRAVPVERYVSRPETAISYAGGAGYQNSAAYVPGEYMPSHNQQFGEVPIGIANANGRNYATDSDYGIKSKMAYPNNRTVNKQDGYFGLVSGGLNAAIAPLLDVLRPSRKENTIGSLRPYQNPTTTVKQSYIFNPADRPAATIRETTENSKNHLNINANQRGGAYQVTEQQPESTYRSETSDFYYAGVASAGARTRQTTSYESGYNQTSSDLKSSVLTSYTPSGNMNLLNSNVNMRQAQKDSMLKNNRSLAVNMPSQGPDIANMGRLAGSSNQLYSNIQMDRTNPDIMSQLKGNPYVVNYKNAL